MNRTILVVGAIIIAIIGIFFIINLSNDYTVTVDNEITELENELAEVETEVNNGTLTPEMAATAQVRISDRLQDISTSFESSGEVELTTSQRQQLNAGLERLKIILTNYQSTFLAVDASVETLPVSERPTLNRGGRSSRTLSTAVVETVNDIQEAADEIIDDYIITPISDLFDEIASSTESVGEDEDREVETEISGDGSSDNTATTTLDGDAVEIELDIDVEATATTSS